MKTLTRDKRRFLPTILCLSLLLSFCFAFTAQAQVVAARGDFSPSVPDTILTSPIDILSSGTPVTSSWVEEVDQQYAASLKETNASSRELALQEIIFIATHYGDTVTFTEVVSPLLNIYIFDKNENHRIMALTALHTIGNPYSMQRLRELVNVDVSENVRRLTYRILTSYYGPKH